MAQGCPICPHCGYSLGRDQPIVDGPFRYDPSTITFEVAGEALPCTPQMREILGGVMLARGRTLTYGAIAGRLGYEGDAPQKLVHVLTCRARRMIKAQGHPAPFVIVRGVGVRWVGSC